MIATGASRRVFPELRIGDTISLPVNVSELTGNRVRLISEMSLPKGRHQIRVASGDRAAGNVLYDLEVPDFTDRPLMMSGLAIAASSSALPTVRAANESKKAKTKKCYEPSCAAQEVRNVPLTAWSPDTLPATYPLRDALPTAPTTARAFRRSDTVTVFAEIYDNKRVPRPVSVRLQLGQPDQKPVSEQVHNVTGTRRASGGYGVTLAMPMSDVPPGRYVLHLVASASGEDHTAAREIPVEVLP
jgi:hypothetical protein